MALSLTPHPSPLLTHDGQQRNYLADIRNFSHSAIS